MFLSSIWWSLPTSTVAVNKFCGTSRRHICKKAPSPMGCRSSKVEITSKTEAVAEDNSRMATCSPNEDYVEGVVCKDSDVGENEMKSFDLGDAGKVLVVRQNGKLSALGAKCTHYGAPLANGALGDGRIRCQWHGACFGLANGDIEDFPGLDSLPCFDVSVEQGQIKVRGLRSEISTGKRIKVAPTLQAEDGDGKHFVIIGGGPAGAVCAETLRQEGFSGKITVVAKEKYLPYDRVKLSKAMDVEVVKLQFRPEAFYANEKIDFIRGTEAIGVDTQTKTVKLSNDETVKYDSLFVATGSTPRTISDLENVFVIREYDDAGRINAQLSSTKRVVILGSSFIGMEVAAFCSNKVAKVTVIGRGNVPFEPVFGAKVGAAVRKLFEDKGVDFVFDSGVKRCVPEEGKIAYVELTNGERIPADLLIVGIGSTLNTQFLQDSQVTVNENGTVEVDEYLETNVDGVFAGGDIANAPIWARDNRKASVGHFGLAQYHGRIAALNMLGKRAPVRNVPFFWSMLLGKNIRYAGHGTFTDVIYEGNVDELKFVAFYLDGDDVVAVAACQMDPIVSRYAELVMQGKKFTRNDLHKDLLGLTA